LEQKDQYHLQNFRRINVLAEEDGEDAGSSNEKTKLELGTTPLLPPKEEKIHTLLGEIGTSGGKQLSVFKTGRSEETSQKKKKNVGSSYLGGWPG